MLLIIKLMFVISERVLSLISPKLHADAECVHETSHTQSLQI